MEGITMETVNVSTFKATCLALLEKVKKTGQPILILKKGKPLAEVIPPPPPEKPESWLGILRSEGEILGDIISPASDEAEWEALYR
jgi:prevent-host-death family protein